MKRGINRIRNVMVLLNGITILLFITQGFLLEQIMIIAQIYAMLNISFDITFISSSKDFPVIRSEDSFPDRKSQSIVARSKGWNGRNVCSSIRRHLYRSLANLAHSHIETPQKLLVQLVPNQTFLRVADSYTLTQSF